MSINLEHQLDDARTERWDDKPEFKRVFLQMLAEARAWRVAGGVRYVRPVREFSGREDYDRKKTGEDWV